MSKTRSAVVATKKKATSSPPSHTKRRRSKKPFVVPPNVRVPSILEKKNSGRWTSEEHLLFLYAIRLLGTGRGMWKKIGLFIPTRSKVQVRTHAQKVFQKQAQGIDVFEALRKNRQLTNYLVSQLTATAEAILAKAEEERQAKTLTSQLMNGSA